MTRSFSAIMIAGFLFLFGCADRPDDAENSAEGPGADAGADADAGDVGDAFSVPELLVDDTEITIKSLADLPARRQALIDFLWGAPGFPAKKLPASVDKNVKNPIQSIPIANLDRVDRLVIEMDQGLKNESFHFVPKASNGRLVIVQQGHDYTLDGDGLAQTIAALVSHGYGVLGGMMPCYNSFPCPGIPLHGASPHNVLIAEVSPPEGDVLKYFVEHLAVSINYLQTQSKAGDFAPYSDFSMTGLSGGGWSTVLYSAIDTRITHSFPCSGSAPMYLRHCDNLGGGCIQGYEGDAEQMHFPLYKHVAGYLDLYAMGAAGAGRKQIQVQIRHDSCCFGQNNYAPPASVPGLTWNQAVRAYEQKIQMFLASEGSGDHGFYRFEIDETASHSHVISPTTLAQIHFGELDGDRRPFDAASADAVYAKGPFEHLWAGLPSWMDTAFPAVGTPAVVESPSGTDIFLRDPSSSLVHIESADPSWTTETWPGVLASDPDAVMTGNVLQVVAVGPTSRLNYWWKAGSAAVVVQVADATTPVVGTPILLSSPAGLDVFVRRIDGGVQHIFRHGVVWSSEEVTNAAFRGFPSGVLTPDGNLHVYMRGEDNTLMEALKPQTSGNWSLTSLADLAGAPGTTMAGSPSALVDPGSNDVIVIHRSPSGDLGQLTLPAVGMSGWAYQLIGRPSGAPPAMGTAAFTFSPVTVPGGVFAHAQEGGVWFYSPQSGWSWMGKML